MTKTFTTWKTITICGKTKEQLLEDLGENVSMYAKFMIANMPLEVEKQEIQLVKLQVKDLGFKEHPTTDEIYAKADELGLELCPAEVGPHLRLQYTDQPLNEYLAIAMKQITGPGGDPVVFRVYRGGGGSWLNGRFAESADQWRLDNALVFALRKEFFDPLAPFCPSDTLTLGLLIEACEAFVGVLKKAV